MGCGGSKDETASPNDVVLGRSEATPLMPPAGRADLTATCAEAVFVRGAVCRRQSLLDAK